MYIAWKGGLCDIAFMVEGVWPIISHSWGRECVLVYIALVGKKGGLLCIVIMGDEGWAILLRVHGEGLNYCVSCVMGEAKFRVWNERESISSVVCWMGDLLVVRFPLSHWLQICCSQ